MVNWCTGNRKGVSIFAIRSYIPAMKKLPLLPYILLVLLLGTQFGYTQTTSVPLSFWGYDAIELWETRGLIGNVFGATRPFTRIEMAGYIKDVWESWRKEPEKFTRVDYEQLNDLMFEFREELNQMNVPVLDETWKPRLQKLFKHRPFSWFNKLIYRNNRNLVDLHHQEFNLYADPVLNYSTQDKVGEDGKKYNLLRWSNGFLFRGNMGPYVGFYFNLTDNHLADDRWDGQKIPWEVWQESGWPFLTRRDNGNFEFDENVATITFNYKYFYLVLGREYNQWGIGHNGNLLLSTNAQLYDQIKFVVRYWRFKYTHLTAFIEYISPEARYSMKDQPHINDYWSGNRLELYLGKGIKLGLSEAIIYGDRSLQLGYLNPLSFFKSVEHYYGDRDNGALGIDAEWRIIPGMKLFGEWFIDDITTGKLGTDWYGNKFGWQGGVLVVNPWFFKNMDFLYEYSRIKPYVYSQSYRDYNKYKHYDTILGHYIGPNSDLSYFRVRKRFSRFLQLGASYQYYRHGANPADRNVGGDPDLPHRSEDAIDATFLDGIRFSQKSYGIMMQYEFVRNLFLEFHYNQMKFNQQDWESLFSFRISLNFGFRNEQLRQIFPIDY